jgi:predicted PurR-regulated permease PerM
MLFLCAQAFIAGNNSAGIIWLLALPVVGFSDNIIRPYVLKGGAELHPLIGFVAAFGALDMIGFYGLFIGPIVAGLFFTLLPMVTRTYPRSPR